MSIVIPRLLRTALYVLLAIFSVASGIVLADRYLITKRNRPPSRIVVGSRFPQDLDWKKANKTLVLALQKNCQYCLASTEFYQRLVSKSAQEHVRLVAVMPDEVGEAQRYLSKAQLNITELKHVQLGQLGIRGTPSLFFVDNTGTIKKAWEGLLSPDKEQEVFDYLGPGSDKTNQLDPPNSQQSIATQQSSTSKMP